MPLAPKLHAKYMARFAELIAEGEGIVASAERIQHPGVQTLSGNFVLDPPYEEVKLDSSRSRQWGINCATLLQQVIPLGHVHAELARQAASTHYEEAAVERIIAELQAIRDDLGRGFFDDLAVRVEAEVSADYMGQAEHLLDEGKAGNHDHVPAAVLAGAVLEKSLRTLCDGQAPPVKTTKPNGAPMMLHGLIDTLKKAGLYNEMKAKQLRAWAAIRNHAAHGEFDEFTRSDVEQMIQGINTFLANCMG